MQAPTPYLHLLQYPYLPNLKFLEANRLFLRGLTSENIRVENSVEKESIREQVLGLKRHSVSRWDLLPFWRGKRRSKGRGEFGGCRAKKERNNQTRKEG
jgi:hypothetical protein